MRIRGGPARPVAAALAAAALGAMLVALAGGARAGAHGAAGRAWAHSAAGRAGARAAASGHVRAALAGPPSQRLSLVLTLRVDSAALQRFAYAVSTPGSPLYGRYQPVGALARRFGARPAAIARALRFLRAAGARDLRVDATGLFIDATIDAAAAQRLFGAPLVRHRSARGYFIAPTAPVVIPAALRGAVSGVIGLDTAPLPAQGSLARLPARLRARAAKPAAGPSQAPAQPTSAYQRATGTPAGCAAARATGAFTPNQYLAAYGYRPLRRAGLAGHGERVALIEIDGFRIADVRAFARCF